jgi:hypothetical protein
MPALLQTNCFMRYKLLRLHEQDDTEGPTYIAQYFTESKALYDRYIELYANAFRRDVKENGAKILLLSEQSWRLCIDCG